MDRGLFEIIDLGAVEWALWRHENPQIKYLDFRGAELSEYDLGYFDLFGADLENAILAGANLNHADLSGANLKDAKLNGVNLSSSNLNDANLNNAQLIRANLQNARLNGANLINANFKEADLYFADLRGSILNKTIFTEASLIMANLSDLELYQIDFEKATINNANFTNAKLQEANLLEASLVMTNFQGAILCDALIANSNLSLANLSETDLTKADLSWSNLRKTNLRKARLIEAKLVEAKLVEANLNGANLTKASVYRADLSGATLIESDFSKAFLHGSNLTKTDCTKAIFNGTDFSYTTLVQTNLEEAVLTDCHVFGQSVWALQGNPKVQSSFVITPFEEQKITVDDLQVAQFIYLILNRNNLRNVIDTITSKAVLILGRFNPERKKVLDAIAHELRKNDLLPIIFDFDRPTSRDFTETIKTLAGMSLFVIADITNPKSAPLELQATIPDYQVPFIPIIHEDEKAFSMFSDLVGKYEWVLDPITYSSIDQLLLGFKKGIIDRAWEKHKEIQTRKTEKINVKSFGDFIDTESNN